jgi:transmembrane sensor
MSPQIQSDPCLPKADEQAASWLARLQSDRCSERDRLAHQRWLNEDPDNERAWADITLLWQQLDSLGAQPPMQAARRAAVAASREAASLVRPRRHRRRRWLMAGAAMVALTVAATFTLLPLQHRSYRTEPGDRHTISLADGSAVTLNTDSAIRVEYGLRTRRVVLERGQAHFQVAHAVLRPFEVEAGNGRIRALGTAFDVYRRGDDVQVTLIEGKVEVATLTPTAPSPVHTAQAPATPDAGSAPRQPAPPTPQHAVLTPGEQLHITPSGLGDTHRANLQRATAWLNGRLVFENERLADVVREVNRYSPVELVVIDPTLAAVRITGVFRAGRAETFVDALRSAFPVKTLAAERSLLLVPAVTTLEGGTLTAEGFPEAVDLGERVH